MIYDIQGSLFHSFLSSGAPLLASPRTFAGRLTHRFDHPPHATGAKSAKKAADKDAGAAQTKPMGKGKGGGAPAVQYALRTAVRVFAPRVLQAQG